jgi:hypothetical protein
LEASNALAEAERVTLLLASMRLSHDPFLAIFLDQIVTLRREITRRQRLRNTEALNGLQESWTENVLWPLLAR